MTPDRPWHELYPAAVTPDLSPADATLLHAWNRHVAERPQSAAVHYFDETLSFQHVDDLSDQLAAALSSRGVTAGDRIAIYLQNDPHWLVTLLAAWKLGAVAVAVNPMLRAAELTHHLTDSAPKVLVGLAEQHESIVRSVVPSTSIELVITTHPLDLTPQAAVPDALRATMGELRTFDDATDFTALLAEHAGERPDRPAIGPDDLGLLTYTSGTTGRSKGAMNTHGAMAHSSTVYARWWDLSADRDVVLGLAPVFHITGAIAGFGAHLASGAPIVLLHRFDAGETLAAIERWRASFVVGASTAFIALSNHPSLKDHNVSSLTKSPSGGAAVGEALVDRVAAATGWRLHGAYGMTETNSPTHLGPPGVRPPVDPESGALSVGVPVPGADVRIIDVDTGEDVPPGRAGEIVVKGPMVVPGYWRLPEESAAAIDDGWLHTGDVGKVTEDGWLFVVDRLKDLINAGGYKVYPRDVEDVLYQHPAVREACVVGRPDEYRGETVVAFVSMVPDRRVEPEELIEFCRERMAAYKYPREIQILDELPKTATGKTLRRELRA